MTQVIGKMKLLKWWMPLLLVAALVAAGGLAWSQSGSGGVFDTSNLPQVTDMNPAYDDEMVTVPETAVPVVLYSLAFDPSTSIIPLGGGDITTLTLTNLISEPVKNGPYTTETLPPDYIMKAVNTMANGDITGDVVVTADVYNIMYYGGCIATYQSTASNSTAVEGVHSDNVTIKVLEDITVHPGSSLSFIIPVFPGAQAVPGAEFMLKAALYKAGSAPSLATPWAAGIAGNGP